MPFCRSCGTEVQAGARFCASCGAPATAAAVSGARNIGTIAAIVLLVGFLLPWVSCRGVERVSGLELAKGQELWGSFPALWLIPIAAIAALVMLVTGRGRRSTAGATVSALAGIGSVVIMLYYYARLWSGRRSELGDAFREVGRIEYGAYLSLLAAIALALCGLGLMKSGRGAPDQ